MVQLIDVVDQGTDLKELIGHEDDAVVAAVRGDDIAVVVNDGAGDGEFVAVDAAAVAVVDDDDGTDNPSSYQ